MDIIFVTLPWYFIPFAHFFRRLGCNVFYLQYSGRADSKTVADDIENLRIADIVPLPLADLPMFSDISAYDYDLKNITMQRTKELAPDDFLKAFEDLYPNNLEMKRKLRISVHSVVANQMLESTGKINIWANTHPDRNFLVINLSYLALIAPQMPSNTTLFVFPLDIFTKFIALGISVCNQVRNSFNKIRNPPGDMHSKQSSLRGKNQPRVALITHKGLNYGNLFRKDLYFSPQTESELHPENLLYFDYSGFACPSRNLQWICLYDLHQPALSKIYCALVALRKGLLHVRGWRQIFGLLILVRFYVDFQSFTKRIEEFEGLKVALIDYEILCPKELLLAFESRGIKTVATQERLIFAFNNLYASIILDHYLCSSPLATDSLKRSAITCINNCIPVGQYRSDNLIKLQSGPLPPRFREPRAKGLKIITALGFHTHLDWQNSQKDPVLNWKAHQHFLEDMIRLSRDVPGVYIILRYKDIDWISLPVFSDIVKKIQTSENITISTDYDEFFVSYDLCAHSDLVIAKHTSLADECLSVGIPVLFHDYTPNTEKFIAHTFAYHDSKVMCFNYGQLLERAQIILGGTPNAMTPEYESLRNEIYGGLGDGQVRQRIHVYLEKLLSDIEVGGDKPGI